jgi:hypothetical protein
MIGASSALDHSGAPFPASNAYTMVSWVFAPVRALL